jgi:hypothetical protein
VGANAQFLNVIATPATVTTSSAVTVGQMIFASPYGYTIASAAGGSGSLSFDVASGSAAISVSAGINQVQVPTTVKKNLTATLASGTMLRFTDAMALSAGVTFTTAGSGTVEINGPVTPAAGAGFRVSGGALAANADLNGAILRVEGGAQAKLNSAQHLSMMTVTSGGIATMAQRSSQPVGSAHAIYLDGLDLSGGGTFDLNDNDLVVQYRLNPDPFNDVRSRILSGFLGTDAGSIISTMGRANASGNTIHYMLDNSLVGLSEWPAGSGQAIDPNSVIAKYTYFGDVNFSGAVDDSDYAVLDGNYGSTPDVRVAVLMGDANLSGTVDDSDYAVLDGNYGDGVGNPLAPAATSMPVVPEPAGVDFAAIASSSVLLLRRRRRARRGKLKRS